jgi:outer membrane receptor protein involved in Fe transport
MKQLVLAVLCSIVFFNAARAHSPAGNLVIKGLVVDSLKAAPLAYVTIGVREPGKKEAVKSTYTQDNGSFQVSGLAPKAYEVVIAFVGFKTRVLQVKGTELAVNLGRIQLSPTASQLKEVEVTAQKMLIKQDIDKISYDVEADPESKVLTGLDMLRKVPLITVDADDNIQVKGSGSFRVLVNGKPSSLFVRDPKEVLKSMPASAIKNIEVITSPPAKYEAEGVGGIINIITNKKNPGGYNGSVNAAARSPLGYNVGGFLTVKVGKLGFSGYVGNNLYRNPKAQSNLVRTNYAPWSARGDGYRSRLVQAGENQNEGRFHYLDGQLSYELDSLNLLTANYSFNISTFDNSLFQRVQNFGADAALTQAYNRVNTTDGQWHGNDIGLDYQHSFPKNKDQLFTLSYKFNSGGDESTSNFDFVSVFNQASNNNLRPGNSFNDGNTNEHTVQADYVQPMGKQLLEMGLKSITRLNSSDYFYNLRDKQSGQYVRDPALSNNFDYRQDIYAAYTSFAYKKDKWGLKLGARLEETRVDANFTSSDSRARQDYFNLIPSVALSRTLKPMQTAKLSYTQRIERPGLWYINPFRNQIDPRNISYGNPDVRPATSHAFEASFSTFAKGASLNTSLFYNFTNSSIQQFTTLVNDSTTATTYGNIGRNQTLGLSVSGNMPVTKKLNVNLNGSVNYVTLSGQLNGARQRNDGITANVFGYAGYKFNKGWRLNGNLGYNSPRVLLQGSSTGYMWNSVSVNKSFLKKDKATVGLNVNSPFQKWRPFHNEINDPLFHQLQDSYFFARRIGVSLNYRFGKLQTDIARKKRGIRNDDVQGGGSSGSGGGN